MYNNEYSPSTSNRARVKCARCNKRFSRQTYFLAHTKHGKCVPVQVGNDNNAAMTLDGDFSIPAASNNDDDEVSPFFVEEGDETISVIREGQAFVNLFHPFLAINRDGAPDGGPSLIDRPYPPGIRLRLPTPPSWMASFPSLSANFINELGRQGYFNKLIDTNYKRLLPLSDQEKRRIRFSSMFRRYNLIEYFVMVLLVSLVVLFRLYNDCEADHRLYYVTNRYMKF